MSMVEDEENWENPCGFDLDELDKGDKTVAEEKILTTILSDGQILLDRIVILRKIFWRSFPDLDEDSLQSQKYGFLNIEISVDNVYKDSYYALQVCALTIDKVILGRDILQEMEYYQKTKDARQKLTGVLCTLQIALLGENVDTPKVEIIPEKLLNPSKSQRPIRDAIILRQIEKIVRDIFNACDVYQKKTLNY